MMKIVIAPLIMVYFLKTGMLKTTSSTLILRWQALAIMQKVPDSLSFGPSILNSTTVHLLFLCNVPHVKLLMKIFCIVYQSLYVTFLFIFQDIFCFLDIVSDSHIFHGDQGSNYDYCNRYM